MFVLFVQVGKSYSLRVVAIVSSVERLEQLANCRCWGQQALDEPHDKLLKALHGDGCECNGPMVIEAGHCRLFQHGDDGDGLEAC